MKHIKYQHFIITKFNLKNPSYIGKNISTVWLKQRFDIFFKISLPSMAGQINKDFTWLVFFDANISREYISLIELAKTICPNFEPVFTNGAINDILGFKSAIKMRLDPNVDFLITTRLDNDDALNINFVSELKSFIKPEFDDYFLNFLFGVQLDLSYNGVYISKQRSNAFISRFERIGVDEIKTVLQLYTHKDAESKFRCFNSRKNRMWLQSVHDSNLSNSLLLSSIPSFSFRIIRDNFNIGDIKKFSSSEHVFYYLKFLIKRLLR